MVLAVVDSWGTLHKQYDRSKKLLDSVQIKNLSLSRPKNMGAVELFNIYRLSGGLSKGLSESPNFTQRHEIKNISTPNLPVPI